MKFTIELTEDEASLIGYALRELSGRRRCQSIEWGGESGKGAKQEAENLYDLADRIDDAKRNFLHES